MTLKLHPAAITQRTIVAVPAYGRHYPTDAEAAAAYASGLDFRLINGPYFSNRDEATLAKHGYTSLSILDSEQRHVQVSITLPARKEPSK